MVTLLNKKYPTADEQHDFMYNNMIPTIQKILGEIRDLVVNEANRNYVKDLNMSGNPSTTILWNWLDYYKFLSINGLEGTIDFKNDFPDGSAEKALFERYNDRGHLYLNK